jgi:hypothetical protein
MGSSLPKPQRATAPAPSILCGFLRLRPSNAGKNIRLLQIKPVRADIAKTINAEPELKKEPHKLGGAEGSCSDHSV